jgi:hypothetical protein
LRASQKVQNNLLLFILFILRSERTFEQEQERVLVTAEQSPPLVATLESVVTRRRTRVPSGSEGDFLWWLGHYPLGGNNGHASKGHAFIEAIGEGDAKAAQEKERLGRYMLLMSRYGRWFPPITYF